MGKNSFLLFEPFYKLTPKVKNKLPLRQIMQGDMEPPVNNEEAGLKTDEAALLVAYRHCSERRQAAIRDFARKLADIEVLLQPEILQPTAVIIQFRPKT